MENVFYLAGAVLAGFAGYSGNGWYFIFIASLIMAIGYLTVRANMIRAIIAERGFFAVVFFLVIQTITFAALTAPVYFITTFFK